MTARTIHPADADQDTSHGEDIDYLEFGLQLPNGKIWWNTGFRPRLSGVQWDRLDLQVNQDKAQQAYANHLMCEGVPYDPEAHRLRIVQRRQQIRFTEPVALVGRDLEEFEPEGKVL